jgi:glycine cleavage system H protein
MSEVRYSKEHCWVRTLEDRNLLVGLTSQAVDAIGEVVTLRLPNMEEEIKTNQVIGMVESDWATTEIYAPVDSKVIEINELLLDDPSMLNEDPMGIGWLMILNPHNTKQFKKLLTESAYRRFLKKELLID